MNRAGCLRIRVSVGLLILVYIAPEIQVAGKKIELDSKVDVWSIGVIIYEMIARTKLSKVEDIRIETLECSDELKEFLKFVLKVQNSERLKVWELKK